MTQISWPVENANEFGMCQTLLQLVVSPQSYNGVVSIDIPLVVDTGTLVCISPQREDFTAYNPSNIKIKEE